MPHPLLRVRTTLLILLVGAPLVWAQPATVRSPIANPTIVNIYWDANWDADNPTMTMAMIDTFTRTLVASTYFSGLAEYVGGAPQTAATFFGGFPAAGCPGKHIGRATIPTHDGPTAPGLITEVDIARLVKCQIDAGGQPSGPNVIFNVFIPAGTSEALPWFCAGGYTAYHFHSGSELLQTAQPFTAIFARPACLTPTGGFNGLTDNLTHELVEAITDPKVDRPGSIFGEIADACSGLAAYLLAGATSDYFSNASGACLGTAVFSNTTVPAIDSGGVTFQVGGASLRDLSMTIHGSGFGTLPGTVITLPATTNLPYFTLTNASAASAWTAGNSLPRNDAVTLAYRSWSPTKIVIDGFGGAFGTGGNIAQESDSFLMRVCNPQSGQCGPSAIASIPLPTVTGLAPASGTARGGTVVTITGSNFTTASDTHVFFGTEPAPSVTVVNSSTMTVETPLNTPGESVSIRVRNSNGTNRSSPDYTYCGPVITSLTPAGGPESGGTTVTITGTCFADVRQVDFNGVAATGLHVDGDTHITVTSPPSDCLQAPVSGTTFAVGVNALEMDPRSPAWNPDTATWSPDTPAAQFTYTGTFPSSHCITRSGQLQSPCFQHPTSCLSLNLRDQLNLQWIGPNSGMRSTFTDLGKYDWARAAIANVASEGLFPGIDAKQFAPEKGVTRAEYVTAMQQLVRAPAPSHPIPFTDMKPDMPAFTAAQALGNLLDVYRDASGGVAFRPGEVLDRQTAAAGVASLAVAAGRVRLLKSGDATAVLAKVPDSAGIEGTLRTLVATAIAAKFVNLPDGRFDPAAPLTRAQMAMFLDRLQTLPAK